jgi:hypothetical protein
VPSTVDNSEYDDLGDHCVEIDRVRKASEEGAARLALDAKVCEGSLDDAGKHRVDFRRERFAKPGTLFLVPVTGVE